MSRVNDSIGDLSHMWVHRLSKKKKKGQRQNSVVVNLKHLSVEMNKNMM